MASVGACPSTATDTQQFSDSSLPFRTTVNVPAAAGAGGAAPCSAACATWDTVALFCSVVGMGAVGGVFRRSCAGRDLAAPALRAVPSRIELDNDELSGVDAGPPPPRSICEDRWK